MASLTELLINHNHSSLLGHLGILQGSAAPGAGYNIGVLDPGGIIKYGSRKPMCGDQSLDNETVSRLHVSEMQKLHECTCWTEATSM